MSYFSKLFYATLFFFLSIFIIDLFLFGFSKPRSYGVVEYDSYAYENMRDELRSWRKYKKAISKEVKKNIDPLSGLCKFEVFGANKIISPFNTEVVFSGPYKGYKSVVITKGGKKPDDHLVLANLDNVLVEVGRELNLGDFIGEVSSNRDMIKYLLVDLRTDVGSTKCEEIPKVLQNSKLYP